MVVFITSNKGKYKEFCSMISAEPVEHIDLDLVEIQGTSDEIIREKVKYAYQKVNLYINNDYPLQFIGIKKNVIVEDSSLEFGCLGGLPGPYIKHFVDTIGCEGLYKMVENFSDKSAVAICKYGYYDGENIIIVTGRVDGTIVSPRGSNGFGWDSIFKPNGYSESYAEMLPEYKNKISDRSIALEKLKNFLGNI